MCSPLLVIAKDNVPMNQAAAPKTPAETQTNFGPVEVARPLNDSDAHGPLFALTATLLLQECEDVWKWLAGKHETARLIL